MKNFVIIPLLVLSYLPEANAQVSVCPKFCSGNGVCTNTSIGECQCFPGFHGVDCSIRLCPAGTAWVDYPSANNTAHAPFAECSNMGICNRTTGVCDCRAGFGGAACDMMLCPMGDVATCFDSSHSKFCGDMAPCSGNGECVPLRQASRTSDFNAGTSYEYSSNWDADMIYGCVCADGWEGYACEYKSCPYGDDPLTSGYSEVQYIDCRCHPCKNGFYLTYNGVQTDLIPHDAGEKMLQHYLKKITALESVLVEIVDGTKVCSATGSVTKITIHIPHVPDPLEVTASGKLGGLLKVRYDGARSYLKQNYKSASSTRESLECSRRGECDRDTGVCLCHTGFTSSDGLGSFGNRGDCGYQYVSNTCSHSNCSGHGYCSSTTGGCICNSGYRGEYCDEYDCGTAPGWFGNIGEDHANYMTCSGVGSCNYTTGLCYDCGGKNGLFTGDTCEKMTCFTGKDGKECSGNGVCLSLHQIAPLTHDEYKESAGYQYVTPWDADMIRGCACQRVYSVDDLYQDYDPVYIDDKYPRMGPEYVHYINGSVNKKTLIYENYTEIWRDFETTKFYRGPYALAVTDFNGYNCRSARCPAGDDPQTRGGVNEIQSLYCKADNGTFQLTFRGNTTIAIPANASAQLFEHRLEQLYTIRDVSVTFADGNTTVCTSDGNGQVTIEFLTELGDLPLISASLTHLNNVAYSISYNDASLINITEYQKGTKEDLECSGRGICNENFGNCTCALGFGSSNGTLDNAGHMGDCSFFNPFFPTTKSPS